LRLGGRTRSGGEPGSGIAALTTAQEKKSWKHEKNGKMRKIGGIKNYIICVFLFAIFLTFTLYTGIYDEMRVLEDTGEAPDNEKPLTEEEEEKLLTPSDTEADPDMEPESGTTEVPDPDAEMQSGDEE
jgi:hypothetical protein